MIQRKLFPFFYLYETRLRNVESIYLFLYGRLIVPLLAIALLSNNFTLNIYESIYECLFGFLIFLNIYEIGYLQNDYVSTKHESNPTIRGDTDLENSLFKFVLFRITISLILFSYLYFNSNNSYNFSICLFFTFIIFFLHNLSDVSYRPYTYLFLKFFNLYYLSTLFNYTNTNHLIFLFYCFIKSFPYAYVYSARKKIQIHPIFSIGKRIHVFSISSLMVLLIFSFLFENMVMIRILVFILLIEIFTISQNKVFKFFNTKQISET